MRIRRPVVAWETPQASTDPLTDPKAAGQVTGPTATQSPSGPSLCGPSTQRLRCGDHTLVFDRPRVMGVLNLTPDSFSDGGQWSDPGRALEHALAMVEDGADVIDVGGESTRPGARPVSEQEELARIRPVLERLTRTLGVPVSVDTTKPGVMRQAIDLGAGMINDVTGLRDPSVRAVLAAAPGTAVCLMHMQGEPRTMQAAPRYDDVIEDLLAFFRQGLTVCSASGIDERRLLLDPGFGFGKTLTHNYTLLGQLDRFLTLNRPLLVGLSRKSMLGRLLDRPVDERLAGSIAAAVLAAAAGAALIRVHDVRQTVDALAVLDASRHPERLSSGVPG